METFVVDRVARWLQPGRFPALTHLEVFPLGGRDANPRAFRPDPDDDEMDLAAIGFGPAAASGVYSPGPWARFFEARLPARLSSLEVHEGFVDLGAFARALEGTRCDVEVFIASALEQDGARWSVALLRTGPGQYRRYRVLDAGVSRDDRADVEALVDTAASLERTR